MGPLSAAGEPSGQARLRARASMKGQHMDIRWPRASRTAVVFFSVAPLLVAQPARAQCTKDTDCKGSRVCNQGACVDASPSQQTPREGAQPAPHPAEPAATPLTAPPVQAPAQAAPQVAPAYGPPVYGSPQGYPPSYGPPTGYAPLPYAPPAYGAPPPAYATSPVHRTSSGWASGAATYGIVAGAVSFALAIGAEATKNESVPSGPLGGAATLLFGVSLPVVAAGGSSARQDPRVTGYSGLRITGWIGYAATLADATLLLSQVGKKEPPDGQILSVGILGMSSLACFIIDAYASAGEANRIAEYEQGRAARRSTPGVVAPFFTRAPGAPHRMTSGLAWLTAF